jgi:hypothetical protein
LPEGAGADQIDDFLRTVRNHARALLWAQAVTGFLAPGPPSALLTGESATSWANLLGFDPDNPQMTVNAEYLALVRSLGIEEGTQRFLASNLTADLFDLVNPIALTQGQRESPSGAPIQASEPYMRNYMKHKGWYDDLPDAGPWLIEPVDDQGNEFSQYAYTQAVINGLRKQRTPEEFLRSIKFREAAPTYFRERAVFEQYMEAAKGDPEKRRKIREVWDEWRSIWLAQHPVFAEELQSGRARERRYRVLSQMRIAIKDPNRPRHAHMDAMAELMLAFDEFVQRRAIQAQDRSQASQQRIEQMKAMFEEWATMWVLKHPSTEAFWQSVIRPESNLD